MISDNLGSGRLAVEHLLSLGRERIGLISGSREIAATSQRIEGAVAALQAANLEPVGGGAQYGAWEESWGRNALDALLSADPSLDGVVCGSDVIARGVLDALSQHGKSAPKDVSVVGHDDIVLITSQTQPRLTTIDMELENLGRRAGQLLSAAIAGTSLNGVEATATRLVVRESTSLRPLRSSRNSEKELRAPAKLT